MYRKIQCYELAGYKIKTFQFVCLEPEAKGFRGFLLNADYFTSAPGLNSHIPFELINVIEQALKYMHTSTPKVQTKKDTKSAESDFVSFNLMDRISF
jgi:hypothetical protein